VKRAIVSYGRKVATMDVATGNAAFGDTPEEREAELEAIAMRIRHRVVQGHTEGNAMDTNGNTVGTWKATSR